MKSFKKGEKKASIVNTKRKKYEKAKKKKKGRADIKKETKNTTRREREIPKFKEDGNRLLLSAEDSPRS
jgi:hypothetical protein